MNGLEFLYCLQLKQYGVIDDQICPKSAFNFLTLIDDRDGYLTLERDTLTAQLNTKAVFISRFQ